MRIFIGLTNVAGYYGPLAQGLREEGHSVSSVFMCQSLFQYNDGHSSAWIARLFTKCGTQRMRYQRKQFLQKIVWRLLQEILRFPLFIWALRRHDAFIFSFGITIFPGDLRLIRLLGKRSVMIYHGSDSRPPFIDGTQFQRYRNLSPLGWVKLNHEYARRVRKTEILVDNVVNLPASSQYLTKRAISFLALGIPCIPPAEDKPVLESRDRVRILHSPSNPEAKGTPLIRKIIAELQAKGLPIDFVEVISQPNRVVIKEIAACDFIIDQAYSDTPLAGFATEAANLGKATIVGGYCQEGTRHLHQGIPLPPSCYCHPDLLSKYIELFVQDRRLAPKLGQMAQDFIRQHWDYRIVAKRMVSILEKHVPAEWLFEPNQVVEAGVLCAEASMVADKIGFIKTANHGDPLVSKHSPAWHENLNRLERERNLLECETLCPILNLTAPE